VADDVLVGRAVAEPEALRTGSQKACFRTSAIAFSILRGELLHEPDLTLRNVKGPGFPGPFSFGVQWIAGHSPRSTNL
jgi:hypothetical protein